MVRSERIENASLHKEVMDDLQAIAKRGLPLGELPADSVALNLRGVTARASNRGDQTSLIVALEGVLRLQLAKLPDTRARDAAQHLFGALSESSGRNLSHRRQQAADASGYEVHHFRKRVEPRLISTVAAAIIADSDTYNRNRAEAPRLFLEKRRPGPLPEDAWAWEALEHEEGLLRIWSAIYSLRADLLTLERFLSMGMPSAELRSAADNAMYRAAILVRQLVEYQEAYGEQIIQRESPIELQGFINLAGWTPELTTSEKDLLCEVIEKSDGRHFLNNLQKEKQGRLLLARWRRELCRHP